LTLVATGHFILEQKRQEVRVGELGFDRLLVSRGQGIEDAREVQLFEHRFELRHGVH
jgi:hypothetical protein